MYRKYLDMLPDSIEILIIKTDYCRITKLPTNLKKLQINRNHPDYDVIKKICFSLNIIL